MKPSIIRVQALTKIFKISRRVPGLVGSIRYFFAPSFSDVVAVDHVSFSIAEGELVGFLGPNGAGKSTTIKMLTGLLVPTSGSLEVDGWLPWKQRTKYVAHIGAVFGQRSTLWWDLPLYDSYELLRSMYHIRMDRYQQNMKTLTDLLGLDEFIHTPVRSLSLGQRMRGELAAALLHEPRLLFLDEPTIGLDVVARERIRSFIRHVNREKGTTVILTTHDLTDVERLCERVVILDHGKLLFDGGLAHLVEKFEDHHLLVVTMRDEERTDVNLPGLPSPVREGRQLIYRFDHRQINASEILNLMNAHLAVTDVEIRRPPIEDTIRRIYEEELLME